MMKAAERAERTVMSSHGVLRMTLHCPPTRKSPQNATIHSTCRRHCPYPTPPSTTFLTSRMPRTRMPTPLTPTPCPAFKIPLIRKARSTRTLEISTTRTTRQYLSDDLVTRLPLPLPQLLRRCRHAQPQRNPQKSPHFLSRRRRSRRPRVVRRMRGSTQSRPSRYAHVRWRNFG
ncbi:hypothetical protein B0H16DRAFT_1529682 [Mycena metata]|uniref:Uncharacterized protein n=1 Tax=Mycena metata TaxID=1033252 RepID=A0AAD7JCN9_9AGAR|nr:hypothetical protein B0H16DRAFT_1529682 [Mycena metata]